MYQTKPKTNTKTKTTYLSDKSPTEKLQIQSQKVNASDEKPKSVLGSEHFGLNSPDRNCYNGLQIKATNWR